MNIYKQDEPEQYNRRENLRIYGVPETNSRKNDGESVLSNIADKLGMELNEWDIQRAHRLGKKPKHNPNAQEVSTMRKAIPIIERFVNHKKRNKFVYAKSKLKLSERNSRVFITEDLTQLRNKLLNYVKNKCDDKFVLCHTLNGKIRMKKSAKKAGKLPGENGKDDGTGKWLTITSPDDLFKHNVDVDFEELNYQPLLINTSDGRVV